VPSSVDAAPPRMRADAARNRARLVAAAREVFTAAGDGAEVTMDAVAKRAGVGIGTLYRHFPTRLELMEAVYREDVDNLRAQAHALVDGQEPWQALAAWLEVFVKFAIDKRALFSELVNAIGKHSELISHSRGVLNEIVTELVANAQAAGVVRADVQAGDVLSLVGGCTMMNLDADQAKRVLRVILDGLHR
jgi:AcrR family transcriptional regulator